MPDNRRNRNADERLEHASYEGLSDKWVSACDLKKGDRVLLSDSKYGIVINVKTEQCEEFTTYNFEVEDFHTYYVGENGVCVHNTNCAIEVYDKFNIDDAYVKPKHTTSVGRNQAKFVGNKIEAEIMLKDAMRNGNIVSTAYDGVSSMGIDKYKYILNAGKVVGTKGQTMIEIILSADGGMLSAFPI